MGTSTWLHHFLMLSDQPMAVKQQLALDKQELHKQVPKLFGVGGGRISELRRRIAEHDVLTFSFVRHPFERLVVS